MSGEGVVQAPPYGLMPVELRDECGLDPIPTENRKFFNFPAKFFLLFRFPLLDCRVAVARLARFLDDGSSDESADLGRSEMGGRGMDANGEWEVSPFAALAVASPAIFCPFIRIRGLPI